MQVHKTGADHHGFRINLLCAPSSVAAASGGLRADDGKNGAYQSFDLNNPTGSYP
jgi:hypothetical protein